MQDLVPVFTALVTVSDKHGIPTLATELQKYAIEILSTGGTAKVLRDVCVPVREVSEYTDFPEILGGRVKTLHPKIFGGILCREKQDINTLKQHHIQPIQLLIVNLYPFDKLFMKGQLTAEQAIEHIDIGGSSLIRAAAKNFESVCVVTDPADYEILTTELEKFSGKISLELRKKLALKAFRYTAYYDALIANYFAKNIITDSETVIFPEKLTLSYRKKMDLRYGENPHQRAALYLDPISDTSAVANARLCQGKALSFNNLLDADCAWVSVKNLSAQPACVIVKHANPCGAAIAENGLAAYLRAYATDMTSAFGGVIALNCEVDARIAQTIIEKQFVEIIIAPCFSRQALIHLRQKPNVRVLEIPIQQLESQGFHMQRIQSGLLLQTWDHLNTQALENTTIVTERHPTAAEWADMVFAWQVVKTVKSNAIVYAKDLATCAIGAGQSSRIFSAKIAAEKARLANLSLENTVMASEAFLPFSDSVELAAESGVTAIIQPGGSIRDQEVIVCANRLGISMIFTHTRHFRH